MAQTPTRLGGLSGLMGAGLFGQRGPYANNPFFQQGGLGEILRRKMLAQSYPQGPFSEAPQDPADEDIPYWYKPKSPAPQDPADEQIPPGWNPRPPAPQDPADEVVPPDPNERLGALSVSDRRPYADKEAETRPPPGDEGMVRRPPDGFSDEDFPPALDDPSFKDPNAQYREDPRAEVHKPLVDKVIAGEPLTPEEQRQWGYLRQQGEDPWWDEVNRSWNEKQGVYDDPTRGEA